MHRRHHQSLSTMGGTGQEPAVEEPDVPPDVWSIRKRCRSPGGGHPPDVAPPSPDPDVGGPKRRRLGAPSAPAPDVDGAPKHRLTPPDPDVGTRVGPLHPPDPQEVVGADVQHLALSDAEGGGPHREGSREPDVAAEGPSPDVEGAGSGGWVLVVDSDTDVEDEGPHPDVGAPPNGRGALEDSDTDVEREPPPEALAPPHNGHQLLVVDSDTDVEEDAADPDVRPPKPPRDRPRHPDVGLEDPHPHGQRPRAALQRLLVDSDTDVEEAEGSPDVGRGGAQMCRAERVLVMETPKPDVGEPQGVDSDTDVEDEDLTQCVLRPRAPQNPRKRSMVVLESPVPDVGGMPKPDVLATPPNPAVSPPSSDTDTGEVAPTPDVWDPRSCTRFQAFPHPDVVGSGAGTAPNSWKTAPKSRSNGGMMPSHDNISPDPDVEAPSPDVVAPSPDVRASNPDVRTPSPDVRTPDPDVRAPSPDVRASNPDVRTPSPDVRTPDPDVRAPSPDVRTPDPDVRAPDPDGRAPSPDGRTPDPDVRTPSPDVMTPSPDVRAPSPDVRAPNPDVRAPNPDGRAPSPAVRIPDPDVRTPSPDVRIPDPDVRASNPDVRTPSPDVRTPDPDVRTPSPDVRTPSPDVRAPSPDVKAPNLHVSAPHPAMAAPHPDVGAQGHTGNTPAPVPAVPTDASTPKSQHLDSSSGVTGGADGAESDNDDVDLFLEPTQCFLPPADKGSPQGWDPEEPTQLFCLPQEEEEEKEEPPQDPPPGHHQPPKGRDQGGGEWGGGPRRSQRLARSRGGGAKEGLASSGPAPLRRSPRLLARPLPEPRPPPAKPRPRRAGTGQSRRSAQEKEEEPIEGEAPQLRPRRSLGSTPPKVLFTGVVASEAMEVALRALGGSVATSVFDCTHLVTDRVRRTIKFLCAVARGVPVVTPEWLHKSATSGHVLAPGPFLVQDRQQEHHFGFSLAQALQRARRHPLLQGYEIHVTPSVRPEPQHMKDIITCSGGTFLPTMPSTYRPRRVVVSCPADAWCWAPALSSRLPLASPELLLTGLLRQRLQLQPFLLPPPNDPPLRNRGPPSTRRRPVGPPQ
ncbi:mediator of DNA damage checkpoint protein 1 [Amazona ochrocephala]